jgi:hypothetical protein
MLVYVKMTAKDGLHIVAFNRRKIGDLLRKNRRNELY